MTRNAYFLDAVRRHDAIRVVRLADAHNYPNRAVWFETANFGWILSAVDPAIGTRRVLLKL